MVLSFPKASGRILWLSGVLPSQSSWQREVKGSLLVIFSRALLTGLCCPGVSWSSVFALAFILHRATLFTTPPSSMHHGFWAQRSPICLPLVVATADSRLLSTSLFCSPRTTGWTSPLLMFTPSHPCCLPPEFARRSWGISPG